MWCSAKVAPRTNAQMVMVIDGCRGTLTVLNPVPGVTLAQRLENWSAVSLDDQSPTHCYAKMNTVESFGL